MPLWHRLIVAGVVLLAPAAAAPLIDRRIARKELSHEAMTRYSVLRRSVTAILFVGLLSARLIAFTQPVRLGDEVTVENTEGVVEEIGLIYTFVRIENGDRVVIPNEKLASDTIRNATIRSREKVAEITVQVPLSSDLDAVVDRLRTATEGEVFVNDLAGNASIVVRRQAASEDEAERVERDLRLRAHQALRAEGVFA